MKSFLTKIIREKTQELGFNLVGFAPARHLKEEMNPLEEYLKQGWQGSMDWLSRNKEKIINPRLLLKDSKTVISLGINYFNERWKHSSEDFYGSFSRYTYGKDYHLIIKTKLIDLAHFLMQEGRCHVQFYVDDGPILEKKWAALCGIGCRGKNSLIYAEPYGSWFFLAELVTDLELEYDNQNEDQRCGDCTICIESCPTKAIESPYRLNASKCISYQTYENKGIVPRPLRSLMGDILYGCDICQEVCPENNNAQCTQEKQFNPSGDILNLTLSDLLSLSEEHFKELFKESAVLRGGRKRLLRNISINLGNTHSEEAVQPLIKIFREGQDHVLKIHSAWALGEIPNIKAKEALENFLKKEEQEAVRKEIQTALDSRI